MTVPIPTAALDDRLGFVGTAGSGKTYGAGTAVERLLARNSRVVIPDPLGVWWGLRLVFDGKTPSPYEVVIFGGPHGDLPITEHAGAIIGETVAAMKESAIVDLSQLGTKAAERRFMLAFLTAFYRNATKDPVHVVFDEADLWAPQVIRDRDQEPAKLLGMMETIVRRGRVAGFVPWLITQRPAVVSKDVLSQVDGLVAFKLTSSQDRKALGDWIEGQADREEGKRILASLPEKQIGEAVVWIPARGILADAKFPEKATYDSSRTPKRGEKRTAAELKPLDLGALKDRLAKVETEAKANDPKALKAELSRLKAELAVAQKGAAGGNKLSPKASAEDLAAARADGAMAGFAKGYAAGSADEWRRGASAIRGEVEVIAGDAARLRPDVEALSRRLLALTKAIDAIGLKPATAVPAEVLAAFDPAKLTYKSTPRGAPASRVSGDVNRAPEKPVSGQLPSRVRPEPVVGDGTLPRAKNKILVALRQLEAIGQKPAQKDSVAWFAGASPSSSAFSNNLGALRTAGLIEYPGPGTVALTSAGEQLVAPRSAMDQQELLDLVRQKVVPAQFRMLKALVDTYPEPMASDALAEAVGASATSSAFSNNKGRLRSLGLIDYPGPGLVRAAEVLFL